MSMMPHLLMPLARPLIGLDLGRNGSKTTDGEKKIWFPSKISDAKELQFAQKLEGDMELEYNGDHVFVGQLAERESTLHRSMFTETKANQELLYLALAALYRLGIQGDCDVVTGMPLKQYTKEERKKIRKILQGTHSYTINGEARTVTIHKVYFTIEGGSALQTRAEYQRAQMLVFIDIGAKTVIRSVFKRVLVNGEMKLIFIENLSTSDNWGWETVNVARKEEKAKVFAGKIVGELLGKIDIPNEPGVEIIFTGGVANPIAEIVKVEHGYEQAMAHPDPLFATVTGFRNQVLFDLYQKMEAERNARIAQFQRNVNQSVNYNPQTDTTWRY